MELTLARLAYFRLKTILPEEKNPERQKSFMIPFPPDNVYRHFSCASWFFFSVGTGFGSYGFSGRYIFSLAYVCSAGKY